MAYTLSLFAPLLVQKNVKGINHSNQLRLQRFAELE